MLTANTPPDTARLTIRPFRESDLPLLTAMHGNPEVTRYVGWKEPPTEQQNREWLARTCRSYAEEGIGQMAIHLKSTGDFIGRCGLRIVEIESEPGSNHPRWFWYRGSAPADLDVTPHTEIGYTFAFAHWGKGYATESVRAFCDHAFATGFDTRITAATFPENLASARVLEKAGFTATGYARGFGRTLVTHTIDA